MLDFDPGAPPSATFDPGPPAALARHFATLPPVAAEHRDLFWHDWGPVFYRGRLNGRAKVLCIASDPGPTERLVGRTLVGDAGQRVQGFLTKLGLTTNYALVNAFPLAVHPSKVSKALPLLSEPAQRTWRNRFYDLATGPDVEAIIAFGGNARRALELWAAAPDVPRFAVPHPSARFATDLADRWGAAVTQLRAVVTPDPDGDPTLPNYGARVTEADFVRIPPADLPWGVPVWIGDDRQGRAASPPRHNSIERSSSDVKHTMIWRAPKS